MVHTTIYHTLSQLVFGRGTILDMNQEAKCTLMKQHNQASIDKGNKRENQNIQSHMYHIGDKVLLMNTENKVQLKRTCRPLGYTVKKQ